MDNQEDILQLELIEQYCHGILSQEAMDDVNKRLSQDNAFADKLQEYQQMVALIQAVNREEHIRNYLNELEQQELLEEPKKRNILWYKLLGGTIAACIALILYVSFSEIVLPDSENDLTIVRDIDPTILSSTEKKTFDNFYAGQSHLVEGNYEIAIINFKEVLKVNYLRPYFREATQWHLIIAYLKAGHPLQAQILYEQVSSNATVYPIGQFNKMKIWWRILWAKIL